MTTPERAETYEDVYRRLRRPLYRLEQVEDELIGLSRTIRAIAANEGFTSEAAVAEIERFFANRSTGENEIPTE